MGGSGEVVSAIYHPGVNAIFDAARTQLARNSAPPEGFLARMENPRDGFDPFRLDGRMDVVFIDDPRRLGIPSGAWRHAVGAIIARPTDYHRTPVLFLNVINSLVRTPWSRVAPNAWQDLGGNMLKETGTARDPNGELQMVGSSWPRGARNTSMKASAMVPKWQEVDTGFDAIDVAFRFMMGGGKSQGWYDAGNLFLRLSAIEVGALVSRALGTHIGGSDEGMTPETCSAWSVLAPKNFMGARPHPLPEYAGEGDPSPHTALGVFTAMKVYYRENHGGVVPTLIQGYGNVARPLVRLMGQHHIPISGIVEVSLPLLQKARETLGLEVPLFWDRSTTTRDKLEERTQLAQSLGATVVDGLAGALRSTRGITQFLSPNAVGHPLTLEVARALLEEGSRVTSVCGAANNLHDIVGDSNSALAWLFYKRGIHVCYDNGTNLLGASSVGWGLADLTPDHKVDLYAQAGRNAQTLLIESKLRRVPVQLVGEARGYAALAALRAAGLSVGGEVDPDEIMAEPDDAFLNNLLQGGLGSGTQQDRQQHQQQPQG